MHQREDLTLAAYAVARGFTINPGRVYQASDYANGVPKDSLHFTTGQQNVWLTARGWRVARLDPATDKYDPPTVDTDFFRVLFNALESALQRHAAQIAQEKQP